MELNLKKNLFRYGKNEALTIGVMLALIFFDILIWSIIAQGMFSVDYRFAHSNNCLNQVYFLKRSDFDSLPTFEHKTGKYCALLQKEYTHAKNDDTVQRSLAQIRQTRDKISQLEDAIRRNRRTMEGNATAYNLAMQENKGLDLAYTEKLKQIQEQKDELEEIQQDLQKEQITFRSLPAIKALVEYARMYDEDIYDRYEFMKKLDLFLSYVFAMLFIIILIPLAMLLRRKFVRQEKYIRLLLINHIIFVAALQGIWITVRFILHILPATLLRRLVRFFSSLHLMALWYYIAIFLLFVLFAAVVYFLQTRGKRRNLYKKLVKGKCWSCGARILDNEYCFSCGAKQIRTCPYCHKKTYVKMPYCKACGHELKEE